MPIRLKSGAYIYLETLEDFYKFLGEELGDDIVEWLDNALYDKYEAES